MKVRDKGPAELVCDRADDAGGVRIANAAPDKFLEIRYKVPPRQRR